MTASTTAQPTPARFAAQPARPTIVQPRVRIGPRAIGPGQPAFIIAEAGVNHDGQLDKALALVDAAADAGADAVKFQVFRADELATDSAVSAGMHAARRQREILAPLELPHAAFKTIQQRCIARGVEFLATPFGLGDVDALAALRVRAIKIASTDLNNTPLLGRAASLGVPLILSTGASTEDEINDAVAWTHRHGAAARLILLHCVSAYPTPLPAARLASIRTLLRRFAVPVGYSDHTVEIQTGGWAVAAGASVLEKHFTLDRGAAGPDHALSLDARGLQEYIRTVRAAEAALGSGVLGMSAIEADVRRAARRSVVAARDLPAGTTLAPEMLALKRPGGGIPPPELQALVGKTLRRPLTADESLDWSAVQ